jgi:hypothetical protein
MAMKTPEFCLELRLNTPSSGDQYGRYPLAKSRGAHHNNAVLGTRIHSMEGRALIRSLSATACAAFAAGAVIFFSAPAFADDNPFPGLAGTWSGTGIAKFDGGTQEKMSCKGYYKSGAKEKLDLSIRCANASNKVELRADLKYANGDVSGSWEERTYNATGQITGQANGRKINVGISGGLTGTMLVQLGGSSHSVNISTEGVALKGVTISFNRS